MWIGAARTVPAVIEAVLWDVGGVILSSPFEAFAAYERRIGLPVGFVRGLNATDSDRNAWAKLERGEVDRDQFAVLFEAEARAKGGELSGAEVLEAIEGHVRPEMVEAIRRIRGRLKLACLTNNLAPDPRKAVDHDRLAHVMEMFDVVVESSKAGCRKPEQRFYEIACEGLGVEPSACVFLDDLGINLKPARAMGMTTIKVVDPDQALTDLEAVVGFPLR
jgi:putative hydrolase of the HAD superfamily